MTSGRMIGTVAAVVLIAAGWVVPAQAAVIYNNMGDAYSQNFDTLGDSGSWTDDTTLTGWYVLNNGGASPGSYSANNGGSPGADVFYSYGESAGERSIGTITTNTWRFAVQLVNNTGAAITAFDLSYVGEHFRRMDGGPNTVAFEYQVFTDSSNHIADAAGWTGVTELNYLRSSSDAGLADSGRNLNGNDATNKTLLSKTGIAVNWGTGEYLWLRWSDTGANSQGVAIDDVNFSTIPEPATLALLGIGGLLMLNRRRKA